MPAADDFYTDDQQSSDEKIEEIEHLLGTSKSCKTVEFSSALRKYDKSTREQCSYIRFKPNNLWSVMSLTHVKKSDAEKNEEITLRVPRQRAQLIPSSSGTCLSVK